LPEAFVALGEYLELMLGGSRHHVEHASNVFIGDGLMEQIAHRVDEHSTGFVPEQWNGQAFRPEPQVEALLVRVPGYAPEPLSESLGVAVGASR